MKAIVENRWTSIVAITAGVAQFVVAWGLVPPHDSLSWASFVFGLGLALTGLLAKDAHRE